MKNKAIIGSVVGAVILLIAVYFILDKTVFSTGSAGPRMPDHEFENWDAPIADKDRLVEDAYSMFDDPGLLSFDELMKQAQDGRVNMISELWRLRRQCPPDMDYNECNLRIRLFLSEKFPPPGNERLLDLFRKYLRYEQAMVDYKLPDNISQRQRYELLRKKRRELFGDDDANLVFGLEEAKVNYTFDFDSFLKSTAGQSGAQRIQGYEQMRKKSLGNYYNTVVEAEPPFNRYDTELHLRENDLKRASSDQRSALTTELRTRYFGREGADRMAVVDREMAEEEKKETDYRAAEQQFLSQNPSLSQTEKDAKLSELRRKILGDEEAEAYARREAYNKFLEQQQKQQQ